VDLALHDTVAVVTGASKGIGLAITRALAAEGAFVVAGARSPGPELEELVRSGNVEAVSVDLSPPAGPGELVAAATARGSLGVVVNNVGAATRDSPASST